MSAAGRAVAPAAAEVDAAAAWRARWHSVSHSLTSSALSSTRVQLEQAGVAVLPDGPDGKPQGFTGTVMVLTTPDAQRSFLVMPPSGKLTVPPHLRRALGQAQVRGRAGEE